MATRARRTRVTFAFVNLVCAFVSIGVGFVVVNERRVERARPPLALQPFVLPPTESAPYDALVVSLRAGRGLPTPPRGATVREDLAVLTDAPTEFARSWRVVVASFDGDPGSRSCIIERRSDWEQETLATGDRVGNYLLMNTEPIDGAPRSVRLTFRELRRGEEVVVVLRADP
jgi:hypothetical protein